MIFREGKNGIEAKKYRSYYGKMAYGQKHTGVLMVFRAGKNGTEAKKYRSYDGI